jgi:hypothetical protein
LLTLVFLWGNKDTFIKRQVFWMMWVLAGRSFLCRLFLLLLHLPAKSAICVFRVSGSGCLDKLKTLTGSVPEKSRTFYLRPFLDKNG